MQDNLFDKIKCFIIFFKTYEFLPKDEFRHYDLIIVDR